MKSPLSTTSPAPRPRGQARKLILMLGSALLLAACGGTPDPSPVPPVTQVVPTFTTLKDQSVLIGSGLDATVQQAFAGSWQLDNLPSWLSASPALGVGNLSTVLTAHRSASVPTSASLPGLSGTVSVRWTSQDQQRSGVVTLKVSADLYPVRGQVQARPVAQALATTDLHGPATGGLSAQSFTAAPRRVLVGYVSSSALTRARQTGRLGAQATVLPAAGLATDAGPVVSLPTDDVAGTLARLRAQPGVAFAVPEAQLHATDLGQPVQAVQPQALQTQALSAPLTPTDDFADLQWAYRLLGYPAVWRDMQQHPYTRAVTVAVLDSGVRYDHPDLKGKLYTPGDGALDVLPYTTDSSGKVTYDNGDGDGPDTDPTDPATPGRTDISHGTHVTGIIAANWGSFTRPCGACSDSGVVGATYTAPIKVLPVRVLDAHGSGEVSDVASGLLYAAGDPVTLSDGKTYTNPHPAQVINLSLGEALKPDTQEGAANIKVICGAVSRAVSRGVLVVVAGGNGGGTSPSYPAACPGAVAVASVSLSDGPAPTHAWYSDSYQQIALSAPGGVPGTFYNGQVLNGSPMPDLILSTGWDYPNNQPGYFLEAGTSQATPQVTALAALLLSKGVATTAAQALDRMVQTATDLGPGGRDSVYGAGMINPAAALGAPAVADTVGLNVQDAQGRSYAPALDALGRFTAYLPDGPVRVIAGRDSNGNGLAGELGEPRAERDLTLGPDLPGSDLGVLTP